MFTLASDSDEASTYQSYSLPSGSDDSGSESRSGSQSPSELTDQAGPSLTSSSSITNFKNPRKRRAQLPSINLAGAVAPIEADEIQQSKSKLPPSTSTSIEEPSGHLSRPTSLTNDLSDKRIRLTSSSSTSSTASLLSLVSEGSQGSRQGSSLSLAQADSFCEPSFVECGQITPSSRTANLISNGEVVGEFELVSGGQECKAVHIPTQTIYHCTALNKAEYDIFMAIVERMTLAKNILMEYEQKELRRLLMPEGTTVLKSKDPQRWYLISPDHHGSLHSFYTTENPTASIRNQSPWTEKESKGIFEQVVRLVSYCHQIGIYFGDFRLQKLVYTTREKTLIRILNLRNIYVAPLIQNDTIEPSSNRKCVAPAYVAPEMMRFDKPYSAKLADIWSLGILLYVLLTGRFPFYAQNPKLLARMIRMGQWSLRPTDRISRSARLLVYGLIRQNPAERPSSKEILMCDWLQNQISEPIPTLCSNSMPSRPNVSVQVNVPDNGRLNEANPRIPPQLLTVLILSASERNSIYASRSDVRASVESFASAWQRSTANRDDEESSQVVPSSNCDRDLLGISVLRAVARRNVGSRS
jgi:serine/threonine protein kinase